MDSEHIEQLLQRYWRCETSIDEERQLREYFNSGQEILDNLKPYRSLFELQELMADATLGDDFDRKMLSKIDAPKVVKARRQSLRVRLMPMFKAAAAIAVVLLMGNVMQRSLDGGAQEVAITDSIGNQVSAPSMALGGNGSAEDVVEKPLQQEPDSVVKADEIVKEQRQ